MIKVQSYKVCLFIVGARRKQYYKYIQNTQQHSIRKQNQSLDFGEILDLF